MTLDFLAIITYFPEDPFTTSKSLAQYLQELAPVMFQ